MSSLVALRSAAVRAAPKDGAEMVTEVIAGERVEVLEETGGWLRVVVPDHRSHLDPRGYPGWVRENDPLVENGFWSPSLMVSARNSAGLPLGALLEETRGGVRLPDGSRAEVERDALRPIGVPVGETPVELSRGLLGLPYRWGGTDSTRGMDCSGLVLRVMQLRGIAVSRDADDQFEDAPFKSEDGWERARVEDLVFFGERRITHVGFYTGGGRYISTKEESGGVAVRGVGQDGYLGFARYE